MIFSGWFSFVTFFIGGKKTKTPATEEDDAQQLWLCQFVKDGRGRIVGESICLDEDILIIKDKNMYLGVPLKHMERQEKTLLVKGLIDYEKAVELGEQWKKEFFRDDSIKSTEDETEYDTDTR